MWKMLHIYAALDFRLHVQRISLSFSIILIAKQTSFNSLVILQIHHLPKVAVGVFTPSLGGVRVNESDTWLGKMGDLSFGLQRREIRALCLRR
jgi:hypothetical protein